MCCCLRRTVGRRRRSLKARAAIDAAAMTAQTRRMTVDNKDCRTVVSRPWPVRGRVRGRVTAEVDAAKGSNQDERDREGRCF